MQRLLTSGFISLTCLSAVLCIGFVMAGGSLSGALTASVPSLALRVPSGSIPGLHDDPMNGESVEGSIATDAPFPEAGIDRIAFVARQGRLATVGADGQESRLLTPAGRMRYSFPTWAPQGQRIAALGVEGDAAGIYLVSDSSRPGPPVERYRDRTETPFYMYWSPDGQILSFLANHRDGIGLYATDASKGVARLLTTGAPVYWDWTRDGRRLLVHAGRQSVDHGRLSFYDLESGTDAALQPRSSDRFRAPGISASGRYIAYGSQGSDGQPVLSIDPQDSADPPFEVAHRGVAAMLWSPVADRLAFISPPVEVSAYYGPLRLIDAENRSLRGLVDDTVLAYFWSPDGRWIAYFTLEGDSEMGGSRARSFRSRPFALAWLPSGLPIVAPAQSQGIQLALSIVEVDRNARGPRVLHRFLPSRTFARQLLPFFDQYALSHRLWSPSSDALVLSTIGEDGRSQIEVVSLSGESRKIADGSIAFWSPR